MPSPDAARPEETPSASEGETRISVDAPLAERIDAAMRMVRPLVTLSPSLLDDYRRLAAVLAEITERHTPALREALAPFSAPPPTGAGEVGELVARLQERANAHISTGRDFVNIKRATLTEAADALTDQAARIADAARRIREEAEHILWLEDQMIYPGKSEANRLRALADELEQPS